MARQELDDVREPQSNDGPDAMREWRWRSYTDHLEDLGYDLDGGDDSVPDPADPVSSSDGDGAIPRRWPSA